MDDKGGTIFKEHEGTWHKIEEANFRGNSMNCGKANFMVRMQAI